MLPGHGGTVLEDSHEIFRERHMASEKCANARLARGAENRANLLDDLGSAGDLADDADLHVIDNQGGVTG